MRLQTINHKNDRRWRYRRPSCPTSPSSKSCTLQSSHHRISFELSKSGEGTQTRVIVADFHKALTARSMPICHGLQLCKPLILSVWEKTSSLILGQPLIGLT
ncbi:unnamed protein product [Linum tenue]|uniref:Uncharacterized protein n=1 Tax=Linum tenue TaxID=586396 RepID=A0AAV0R9M8_9ROSI|nr:unnamed protein product [Linum tenue]